MSAMQPELPPDLTRAMKQAADISRVAQRATEIQGQEQRKLAEDLARSVRVQYDAIFKPLVQGVLKVNELWRAGLPANWQGLSPGHVRAALELIDETGLCLVWVPRDQVIVELIQRGCLDEQLSVLEMQSGLILNDMTTSLSEIGTSDVGTYDDARQLAEEAVAAALDGHFGPSQTSAAAGVTGILHGVLGYSSRGGLFQARLAFEERDLDEVGLRLMKITLIELCTARALVQTEVAGPGFNRHGSQHGIGSFFSKGNALAGMMLLVAWVRELWWFEQHYPEVFGNGG